MADRCPHCGDDGNAWERGYESASKAAERSLSELTESLRAELARLREALEFYGAAETWMGAANQYMCGEGSDDFEVVDVDGVKFEVGGKRAREALGK